MKFSEEAKAKAEGRFPNSLVAMDWFSERDMLDSSENIVLVDKISSGAFATVYRGLYEGKYYAVKKEQFHEEGESQANLLVELSLLQTYPHDRLVKFVAAAYDSFSNGMLIVMELCSRGDLRHFMREYTVSWPLKMQIAIDIARGLNFMHEIGIIHRDIKTSNILIDENFNGKICDFSFSIFDQSTDKLQLTYGTDEFMSPEIALALDFSFKSDIFSFGIVLSEMITEREPSKDFMARRPQNMFAVNESEVKESILDGCPVVMEALALQCCDIDVSRRPLSSDVIEELTACLLSEYSIPPNALPQPGLRTAPSPHRPPSSPRNSITKDDSGLRIAMLEQQMKELQSENKRLRSDIALIIEELTPTRAARPSPVQDNGGFLTPRQSSFEGSSLFASSALSNTGATPAEAFRSELDSLQNQLDVLRSSIHSKEAPVSSTPPPSPAKKQGVEQAPPKPSPDRPRFSPARVSKAATPPNPPCPPPKTADHLARALNTFLEIADKCSTTADRSNRFVAQIAASSNGVHVHSGSPPVEPQIQREPINSSPRHVRGGPGAPAVRSGARSSSGGGGGERKLHVPIDYTVPPKHPASAVLAQWQNKAYESMQDATASAPTTEGVSLQRPSLQP